MDISISFFDSSINALVALVALSIELAMPVFESINLLPAFFASSTAPVKSPENTFLIAEPRKPNICITESILTSIFLRNASLKFWSASCGFSNTEIIRSPSLANISTKLPTTTPIALRNFLNLF